MRLLSAIMWYRSLFYPYTILFCLVQAHNYPVDVKSHKYEESCKRLNRDPYFEPDMVTGKPWRIYYTWNMNIENKCMDMVFKNVTPSILSRIFNDMYDYLETQPVWESATLYLTMGSARHEMLLFADQGAAGNFVGVPNVIRDGNITPIRNAVPLLKFRMKILREGRYLVMMDCDVGVVSLSARADQPPYRSELAAVGDELDLGEGWPACVKDRNKDDQDLLDGE